jgi:hypothetical protein
MLSSLPPIAWRRATYVRGLHEARQRHFGAEHRTDGVQPVGRQPVEALERKRGLELIDQDVVGDLLLAGEPRAIELAHLRQESRLLSIVLVALSDGIGGEPAGMEVDDRAVEQPDRGEQFRVPGQELERLAVGQHVDGEGLAPDDAVPGVAQHCD